MGAFAVALVLVGCLHGGGPEKTLSVSCICPAAATLILVLYNNHMYRWQEGLFLFLFFIGWKTHEDSENEDRRTCFIVLLVLCLILCSLYNS